MPSPLQARKRLARAELIRRLSELSPKKRLDAMLEERDGRSLVRQLPAEDVYATIIDVGLNDSVEVVQVSTPEQFRTYVDLAAWQRDRIDPLEVLHWLRAARGDDDDAFIGKVTALDIEVLEFLFKQLTVVHDLEADPDVNPAGVTIESPEGRYLIELKVDGPDEAALRRLIMDLMAKNPFELSRFFEAVRWEMPSELEEVAHQFRKGRLQDLGFPPLEEATRLFAWLDPDKVAKVPKAMGAPVALAPAGGGANFVEAAFRGLSPDERESLESEVRYLVNSVLVAEGAEPGDPQAIRRISEQARDALNLGLEHLCAGDPSLATEAVRAQELRVIFQVGFSLTLRLKREVEKLGAEPQTKFGETWLALDDETAALAALLRRRPMKALKVPGAEPVPFRHLRELAEAEQVLARVRLQRAVFAAVLGEAPAETAARFGAKLSELTPQRALAAAVAWAEVGGPFEAVPLDPIKLTELCERLFDGDAASATLRPSAGQKAKAALAARVPPAAAEAGPMVDRVLQGFLRDFGATYLRDGRVDGKRLQALPVAGELTV